MRPWHSCCSVPKNARPPNLSVWVARDGYATGSPRLGPGVSVCGRDTNCDRPKGVHLSPSQAPPYGNVLAHPPPRAQPITYPPPRIRASDPSTPATHGPEIRVPYRRHGWVRAKGGRICLPYSAPPRSKGRGREVADHGGLGE